MRSGRSLVSLAQELTRINESKRDFMVPTQKLVMQEDARMYFTNGETHSFGVTDWASNQMAQYLDIPRSYYERMRSGNPELLSRNVNWGLNQKPEEKRMLRTLDGSIRAVLSSRYRRLDSFDLVEAILPTVAEAGLEVVSSEITEKRLYVRALSQKLKADVKVGDTVQYGIQISSSDVGAGSLRVEPMMLRLVCMNGMISDYALKKTHLGRSFGESEDVTELLSETTMALSDAAFWSQVRDVVHASLKPEVFEMQVEKMKDASEQKLKNFDLEDVIDITCKTVGYQAKEGVKSGVMEALASGSHGAGLTKWGLAQSFAYVAEHSENVNFDECVELERVAGRIVELAGANWRGIAER